ncbi:MAG: Uma2 family endonuclease [Cyanobacteria bacterium J06598_3]
MVLSTQKNVTKAAVTKPVVTWEPLPDDFVLPDDPVENIQQPPLAAALTDALGENGRISPDMLMGSNFALVATLNKRTVVKAPDWFYTAHVYPVPEDTIRRSYTPNLEGEPVAIVMEFLSADDCGELSIRPTPPYGKLYFYEQILQVPTYVTYDPYDPGVQVRHLEGGRYVLQEADANGRFYIPALKLNLGLWKGARLGKNTHWLRWWDEAGNLLLWSSEQAKVERQKAETERQKAETERQKAETERQKADVLAAKLKELGIDPDTLT